MSCKIRSERGPATTTDRVFGEACISMLSVPSPGWLSATRPDPHTIRHGLWRMHTQCRRCLRMTNGTVLFTTMILFDPAAVAWCIDYMHTTDVAPLLVHDYC